MSRHFPSPALLAGPFSPAEAFAKADGRGFIALLEAFRATGGTAPSEALGQLLQAHRPGHAVSLARLLGTAEVFAFPWRAGLWVPMFQFDAADLSPKAGAQRVRRELPAQWSGWAFASWFAAPNDRLDGRRAVDMIDLDLAAVIRAAQGLPAVDEAPRRTARTMCEVAASV
jgi:hypothetical protein